MFDLNSLDTLTRSQTGTDMPVTHPRTRAPILQDNGQPHTITLRGRNSDAYRDMQRSLQERRADMAARGIAPSREELERDDVDLLVACTVGWTDMTMDGQPFPYSPENARRLWSDRRFVFLRDAAITHIREDANFLPI